MLKYGTYCSYGTTEYAALIRDAADSANISSVLCDIDSGGGAVDAIAPLVDAILYARGKGKAVVLIVTSALLPLIMPLPIAMKSLRPMRCLPSSAV